MTNYTDLVNTDKTTEGSIRQWINNSTVPPGTILTEAEAWLYERIRTHEMLKIDTSLTMSVGVATLTLPSDFLQARSFFITGGADFSYGRLRPKMPEEVEASFGYNGATRVNTRPDIYYVHGGTTIEFDVPADKTYTTRLLYYAIPTALGSGNTINFLTQRYPRLLRAVCVAFANEFLKDQKEKLYWLQLAMAIVQEVNVLDERNIPETAELVVDGHFEGFGG